MSNVIETALIVGASRGLGLGLPVNIQPRMARDWNGAERQPGNRSPRSGR